MIKPPACCLLILLVLCLPGQFGAACASGENDGVMRIQADLDQCIPVTEATMGNLARILEADPHNRQAHLALASCYDRLGLPDQAGEEYAVAAQMSPDDPHALVEFVKSLVRGGQSQQGMKLLEAASKRFPNDPEVMFWYANYLASTNHQAQALKLYNSAMVKLSSMTTPAMLGLPSALGELYLENQRYGDAIKYAEKDIAIDKEFWLAYKIKGFALYGLGRYDQAREYLGQAYHHMPYKPQVAKKFAAACVWNADYKQALDPALVDLAMTSALNDNNFMEKHQVREIVRKLPEHYVRERIAVC
ncbi:MAG: tetratricopeptide repeat protein, partial [Terriglobales bacterium]